MRTFKPNHGAIAFALVQAVLMQQAAAQSKAHLDAEAGVHVQEKAAREDAAIGRPATLAERSGPTDPADSAMFMVVRVTGLRAVPWKSYRAMRAAVAAYEKYRFLAPNAAFSFAVLPSSGKPIPPGFKLRVRTEDGQEFPVTLKNDELFQLPALPGPMVDADLVSNLKGGQLRIGLLVHTPGVPLEKERLGDVRLRALINEAIAEVDDPNDDPRCLHKRHRNDCSPRHVTVWHKPRAPTSGASIVEGNRRETLETNDDPSSLAYKMPISGAHWGDDAIIEFNYTKPLRPLRLSEVAIYEANN